MDFLSVALVMVKVSLPILLGWGIAKIGFMKPDFESELSRLLLQVAMPCLTLSSALGDVELPSPGETFMLMFIAALLYAVAIVVAFVLVGALRAERDVRGVYRFVVIFGNAGFIGFPVIESILGKQALFYAAVGLIPANLVMFTVGVMLFAGTDGGARALKSNLLSCIKSPTLIASVAALAISLTGLNDWGVLGDSISIVGNMNTPCALLLVGSSIAKYDARQMVTNWRAYVACAGRLVLVPIAGLVLVRLLLPGVNPLFITTLVLEMAMPVGSLGTLYCIRYNKDALPMMQGTFLSIVFSVITIPLITVLCTM